MKNESDVKEWVRYANMDVLSANHLNEIQYPKPLEIICYHCQQAAEKMLKALLLAYDGELQKTHDLGVLTDELSKFITFSEDILNSADGTYTVWRKNSLSAGIKYKRISCCKSSFGYENYL